MPLLRLSDIHLAYGTHVLLDGVELTIQPGERWGLLGRNGAGKSTFMKLLKGDIRPDSGEVWTQPEMRIAYLDQELPQATEQTVFDYIADGLADGALIKQFHHLLEQEPTPRVLQELERVQHEIDAKNAWSLQQKVDNIVSLLELPADKKMQELSGGWSRRVALGRALVCDPDLLLLDEPTNHLDIPAIEWLERQLQDYRGAVVVITHDRSFLQNTANRILELDRGALRIWQHDYRRFLEFREQQLEAEAKTNMEFDKKLAQEEVWIRQGIKARRTRNEGRVRALEQMRREYAARRNVEGKASMELNMAGASGKIVLEADKVSHSYDGRPIIRNFSTKILRGDKIGLIGPNGCGKTTLLKILLGQLQPDSGSVKIGTKLELAYFDQFRAELAPEKSVIDNLAEGSDHVTINGKPRHVISYLQDFLFSPDRLRQPVKALSGGEQNRLILARLFSKPANLLVLDEPTNDLDLETLELLEELLHEFSGTLLLVSHDRAFLDNVVTSSIVFEGQGVVKQYVGGYQDWLRQRPLGARSAAAQKDAALRDGTQKGGGQKDGRQKDGAQNGASQRHAQPRDSAAEGSPATTPAAARNKLSYKLQRELDQLPAQIEKLENEIAALEAQVAQPEFYQKSQNDTDAVFQKLGVLQKQLDTHYSRWQELEQQQ